MRWYEKVVAALLVVAIVLVALTAVWWSIQFYTAPCSDFKQPPLSSGYAPARCIR